MLFLSVLGPFDTITSISFRYMDKHLRRIKTKARAYMPRLMNVKKHLKNIGFLMCHGLLCLLHSALIQTKTVNTTFGMQIRFISLLVVLSL